MKHVKRNLTKLRRAILAWGDSKWSLHCRFLFSRETREMIGSRKSLHNTDDSCSIDEIKISQRNSVEVFFYSAISAYRPMISRMSELTFSYLVTSQKFFELHFLSCLGEVATFENFEKESSSFQNDVFPRCLNDQRMENCLSTWGEAKLKVLGVG